MNAMHAELFEPLTIGRNRLRNRIVVPPMVQLRPLTSPQTVAWYRRMAAGGAAMVIVEATGVPRFGAELTTQTLSPIVEAIHDEGAVAAIQLFPIHFNDPVTPDQLSGKQIATMIDQYERAATVCREAGFDGVEPHGAHGYLLNQFFMPDRNHRDDQYGGTLANRGRLATEIVDRIRQSHGDSLLVLYRHTPLGEKYTIDDSLELAKRLIDVGVDILDISPARQAVNADLAAPFKARFSVPIIAVGEMENAEQAAATIRQQRCDLVALGRQLIADARWPDKVYHNRFVQINECEKCDIGCFGHLKDGKPVECVQWISDEVHNYVR